VACNQGSPMRQADDERASTGPAAAGMIGKAVAQAVQA